MPQNTRKSAFRPPPPPQLQGLLPRRLTSGFLKREQRATKTPRGKGRARSPTSPVPSLCSLGTGRLPGKHEGNISKQKQATKKQALQKGPSPFAWPTGVQAELLEIRPGSSGSGSRCSGGLRRPRPRGWETQRAPGPPIINEPSSKKDWRGRLRIDSPTL